MENKLIVSADIEGCGACSCTVLNYVPIERKFAPVIIEGMQKRFTKILSGMEAVVMWGDWKGLV